MIFKILFIIVFYRQLILARFCSSKNVILLDLLDDAIILDTSFYLKVHDLGELIMLIIVYRVCSCGNSCIGGGGLQCGDFILSVVKV